MKQSAIHKSIIRHLVKVHQLLNIAIEEAKSRSEKEQHVNRQLLMHISMIDIEILQIISSFATDPPMDLELLFDEDN